jgi:uncharacterized protein (DUF58 family)
MPRKPGWWARLQARFEDKVRQRVTKLGIAYTVVTVAVGVAAFLSANNLLFLILAALLATLLVSGFVSRLGLAGLRIDLLLPDHISARTPASGRVRIENQKAFLPSFSIRLEGGPESGFRHPLFVPVLPARSVTEELVQLEFTRRGQYREDSFLLLTQFPFGFTERRVRVAIDRDVVVYPAVTMPPGLADLMTSIEGEFAAHLQGRGDEFHRIRPYEYNETIRRIDWKSTAHTGQLQVREYLTREQPSIEIVLDTELPPGALEWFERAIHCCAYLAWSLHERQAVFRFRSQRFDKICPDEADVYGILRFLALVEPCLQAAPLEVDADHTVSVVFSLRDPRAVRLDPA